MHRTPSLLLIPVICLIAAFSSPAISDEATDQKPLRKSQWNGYDQIHFQVAQRDAYIVVPKQAAAGNPWVWRARFPGYHAEADIKLVGDGFHVGYIDVAGMFGSPRAVDIGNKFYQHVIKQYQLAPRVALEGVSRGGLFVYNWAAANADRVACIYCDTPVCDFKSWPGGLGSGIGSPSTWTSCLAEYGLDEKQALVFEGNPIDQSAKIAAAEIPILHIVSENDRVVPPKENTMLLKARLQAAGHDLQVISVAQGTAESNGHHFTHPAVDQVVQFIKTSCGT